MGSLIDTLKANWSVIAQAPLAFAIWTLALIGIIWVIVAHLKSNQIEALDGRLKLRDDEISDYKRKLSGASPDEAKARIEALELAVSHLTPKRLADDQLRTIVANARIAPGAVSVTYDMAYAAGQVMAGQLQRALAEAGWQVTGGMVGGPGFVPPEGLAISLSAEAERTPAERALLRAFEVAGLKFASTPKLANPHRDAIDIVFTQPAD